MTKQASRRGRQQQTPIFGVRCISFPKSLHHMAACGDPGQARCLKGSVPISVPAPVLGAAARGVPGRRSWSLVLHKRASHRLHRLGGESLNLCLPALEEGCSLFLTALRRTQNPLLFLQLPRALLNTCQFSTDPLHFDLRR